MRIPRALDVATHGDTLTLHASERAYAAVFYLKGIGTDGEVSVRLVTAKSKVAPVKPVTLPRLSAAALLARLTNHVIRVLDLLRTPVYLWTDSTITFGWIQGHASRWKTYVANRVAEIQSLVPDASWNHLPEKRNPADCATRSLLPSELANFGPWWGGSEFLR